MDGTPRACTSGDRVLGGGAIVEPPGFEGVFDDVEATFDDHCVTFKKRWCIEDHIPPRTELREG